MSVRAHVNDDEQNDDTTTKGDDDAKSLDILSVLSINGADH